MWQSPWRVLRDYSVLVLVTFLLIFMRESHNHRSYILHYHIIPWLLNQARSTLVGDVPQFCCHKHHYDLKLRATILSFKARPVSWYSCVFWRISTTILQQPAIVISSIEHNLFSVRLYLFCQPTYNQSVHGSLILTIFAICLFTEIIKGQPCNPCSQVGRH